MSTYFSVITNAGAAKIAAALAGGTSVPLASIAIGDGGGTTPTPVVTQTALVNEVYRRALNKLYQDPAFPNTMVAEMIVPASDGGWTAREVGLVATDGTFIAIGNMPTTVKAAGGSGSASTLVIKLYFQVSSSGTVSLTIDPSTVLATESWVNATFLAIGNNLSEIAAAGTTAKNAACDNIGAQRSSSALTLSAVLQALYPVGEMWITHRAGNPNTLLGFGAWSAYGQGKVLVGYNAADADFNALDKTGGEKTHALSSDEIPSHAHDVPAQTVTTDDPGDHVHAVHVGTGTNFGNDIPDMNPIDGNIERSQHPTDPAGAHTHSVTIPDQSTGPAGGGVAHNNMPPYTTVFMWLRTA